MICFGTILNCFSLNVNSFGERIYLSIKLILNPLINGVLVMLKIYLLFFLVIFTYQIYSQPKSETVTDRLLRYVKIDTQSQEDATQTPSTQKQFNLARLLVQELKDLGIQDARVDSFCFVYGTLPGNLTGDNAAKVPAIGLIAHMDTSPAVSDSNVHPIIHKNYQGGNIVLPGDTTEVLTIAENPHLLNNIGTDIITTDGTTLLGGDDKAGIAEIMTVVQTLVNDPSIKHGTICIAFTPDEEEGTGVDKFDVKHFGATYAYTIDGTEVGEINNETWNADAATIIVHGKSFHPGDAKGKMVNAMYAAAYMLSHIPDNMKPETTEKKEGFIHPYMGTLDVEETRIKLLLRDFEVSGLEAQKKLLFTIRDEAMQKFPGVTIDVNVTDDYRNMKLKLDKVPFVTDYALEACKRAGVTPLLIPIRGGTDGSNLTDIGLPCPNIFAGEENEHSKLEWTSVREMEKAVKTLQNLIEIWVEKNQ